MSDERSKKFQWISIVYLLLFALAVFSPSLVKQGYFGLHEQHVEEALIFLFGLVGISIFMLYERLMEKKEKEHLATQDACDRARRELVSSYQYIGSLNRQMDLLKKLSNDTSVSIFEQDQLSKDLLDSIVRTASGTMGGVPSLLRVIRLDKLRTEHEVFHDMSKNENGKSLHISNKQLKQLHDEQRAYHFFTADDHRFVAVPSDRNSGDHKAFLILKWNGEQEEIFDPSVIKVFANQAELIYGVLQKRGQLNPETPLDIIESVTNGIAGEVN
ncbi:MAG: hypothetical protein P1P90_03860 [Patescibacteria group bacterium]|nr:hypothetical protein [Patescibacteria group bacterium]